MWNRESIGFLPSSEPLFSLSVADIRNTELAFQWENLSHMVPHYLKEECAREEIIYTLRISSNSYYDRFVDNLGLANYERAFLILSYLATAYINAPEGKKKSKLPKELSLPLVRLSALIERMPVIDYTSYILYNWKKKKQNLGIPNNIEILNTFTDTKDEQILVSTLVEMEYVARALCSDIVVNLEVISEINDLLESKFKFDSQFLEQWDRLLDDYECLSYEQTVYREGRNYCCGLTLQSPILKFFHKYLDISFKDEYLKKREYEIALRRPKSHNLFLDGVAGIRYFATKDKYLKDGYNVCLSELIRLYRNLVLRKKDATVFSLIEGELNGFYL